MKSIACLSIVVPMIFACAFTCEKDCTPYYAAGFEAYTNDSTLLFDSIVNISEGETVWINHNAPWQHDSIEGRLNINPEKTGTVFYFYSPQRVDTLEVEYAYHTFFDRSCKKYVFELEYGTVVNSSFNYMNLNGLNVSIYLE